MAQIIDFLAKKAELEKKKLKEKKQPLQQAASSALVQKEEVKTEAIAEVAKPKEDDFNFEDIVKHNASLKDKLSTERLKYNESVKRSYKLKPKDK